MLDNKKTKWKLNKINEDNTQAKIDSIFKRKPLIKNKLKFKIKSDSEKEKDQIIDLTTQSTIIKKRKLKTVENKSTKKPKKNITNNSLLNYFKVKKTIN